MIKKLNKEKQGHNLQDLKRKAEKGDAQSQYDLGAIYHEGVEVIQDLKQAVYWYKKACDQGHSEALFRLGMLTGSGQGVTEDYAESKRLLTLAADQGHDGAKMVLEKLSAFDSAVDAKKRELGL